ncbi:MAG TPA: hypothetical protein VNQ79_20445 [Blastocatellia bacterium]|nr:hypothetical protein [Blastocatellia bacterium]
MHEFADGLTCKAFGGRATEIGGLLIYYFLPALCCNVSGIHLIPQRGRRLEVTVAGVYWQLIIGAAALLLWFLPEPYTLAANAAFVFFCGSVPDVTFNGNPLIRVDGCYFLSRTLTADFTAARQRLESALIEHRRHHTGLATALQLAQTDAGTERLQVSKPEGELRAVRALIVTLEQRQDLLRRRLAQFALVTSPPGAVFGEHLPRLIGQHFQKGAEICRVADTRQMLLRIQAPEREIADVRVGSPVRLRQSRCKVISQAPYHRLTSQSAAPDFATARTALTLLDTFPPRRIVSAFVVSIRIPTQNHNCRRSPLELCVKSRLP